MFSRAMMGDCTRLHCPGYRSAWIGAAVNGASGCVPAQASVGGSREPHMK